MTQDKNNLIWIDLEMTGLNLNKDRIIEIALVITDSDLNVVAEGPVITVHQPDALLDTMDEWNTRQHGSSGLTQRVKESTISEDEAEATAVEFLKKWVPENASPMCGNSICNDRRFLAKYMPTFERHFHYRNLDVTTIKILAQRWRPDIAAGINKESEHLALADVYDSINELKYYRAHWLS